MDYLNLLTSHSRLANYNIQIGGLKYYFQHLEHITVVIDNQNSLGHGYKVTFVALFIFTHGL